jgi:hypothetical protein
MSGPVLYSTNPYFSIEVAQRYRGASFYAWCSEVFALGQQAGLAPASRVGASSDPMTIYEQLAAAVESEDRHDSRIAGYKKKFPRLADVWLANGEITQDQRDEIRAACKQHSWKMWRPLLFVIPRGPIEASGRLTLVPTSKRAAHGAEFIVSDLKPAEFDIIELPRLR